VFYLFHRPPLIFDQHEWAAAKQAHPSEASALEEKWGRAADAQGARANEYVAALASGEASRSTTAKAALQSAARAGEALRKEAKALVGAGARKDADYIFIRFVLAHFPIGLLGLLVAVILCAAMSATASALSALGSSAVIDFYKVWRPERSDAHYVTAARWLTAAWGGLAVAFAVGATLFDNLIQAVNVLGSIFYGPMLGVFLVGFFLPRVKSTPAFIAVLAAQAVVIITFAESNIGYLWYNVIGCAVVVLVSLVLNR
jgi:Na+/proline symporter